MCVCDILERPGRSSMGYVAAVEQGPLLVSKKGSGLDFNEHSWTKEFVQDSTEQWTSTLFEYV